MLLNNNKLEDFDYETSHRKQLKENIYLARVTRVEPSLQAAFVEYGGNRQGFLAFSEIHPDYYRIPVEDREKLLAEEEELVAKASDTDADSTASNAPDAPDNDASNDAPDNDDDESDARETRRRHARVARHYKIQEVISHRQILLIQVVKEERGNKGAALTTYLSLAGRYCVLMPNTHHGGGVSRKISNPVDRKKLKTVVNGLDVPKGMAVIVRTAGSKRTKAEITRDFSYLTRQWNDIRDLTMESSAPALIHEEGNLIKRSIRDYYGADVEEVIVEGEEAFKSAKMHMKNLMPSHVKKVKSYDDTAMSLFQRHQVENMLSAMHEPQVVLKSGGYLVINQTEALVAIDINSGRATKERNIEETALKTNLEAAEEIAQQLRQRDLSGLVVIDFIDMDVNRNQNAVERKLKDALRNDRARIQVGSISQFGLLEMSRQRLRPSLAESVTNTCPHCDGTGRVRSVESASLQVLRSIEVEASKAKGEDLKVFMNAEIALYILNHKHGIVAEIEQRLGIAITLEQDNSLITPDIRIGDGAGQAQGEQQRDNSRDGGRRRRSRSNNRPNQDTAPSQDTTPSQNRAVEDPIVENTSAPAENNSDDGDDEDKPRRRRRRGKRGGRRRGRRDDDQQNGENTENSNQSDESPNNVGGDDADGNNDGAEKSKPPRNRRRTTAKVDSDETPSNDGASVEVTTVPATTPVAKKAKKAKKAAKAKTTKAKTKTNPAEKITEAIAKKAPKAKKAKKVAAKKTAVIETADSKSVKKKRGWWS